MSGGAGGSNRADAQGGLRLERVSRHFGEAHALRDVSFDVRPGELAVLVGPSGCGKSTTLRVIAGFEPPDAGRILLGGADVTGLPPEKRGAAMVFQHYALFPNLTAAGNVGYGPRVQGAAAAERDPLVREMLALVDLAGLGGRRPHELSGGQQQRVALARALAARPRLLLLDEPLSNVDPSLRRETRQRLRTLHDARGVTTVWVTHDREEALAVADRVVILRAGAVIQHGTPRELCTTPAVPFVAEFLLDAQILSPEMAHQLLGLSASSEITVRPEFISMEPLETGSLRLTSVSFGALKTELVANLVAPSVASGSPSLRALVDTAALPEGVRPGRRVRATVQDAGVLRFGP